MSKSEVFTVDEFGDLFGLSVEEREAVRLTLVTQRARSRPTPPTLRHPDDLLTPEQRERLQADLARMAKTRARATAWAATQTIG